VLPQSSAEPDAGDSSVQMWLEAGAKAAAKLSLHRPDAAAALRRATLIWMPGGDQNRFMKAIAGTGLDESSASGTGRRRRRRHQRRRRRHRRGHVHRRRRPQVADGGRDGHSPRAWASGPRR
jgi:hypothetical protein